MRIEGINSFNQLVLKQDKNHNNASFSDILKNFIADINNDMQNARKAEELLASGKVENIEELMYQIEKSDISLKLITEIRNKALESYQEIMRMQV